MNISKKHKLIPSIEKEIKGNIWDYIGKCDAMCIPINLYMKDEKNIMGAGLAKELKERYPEIPHSIFFIYNNFGFDIHILMTEHLTKSKNNIITGINTTLILGFPTKPEWIRVNKSRSNVLPYYKTKPFVFAGKDIPGYMGYSDLKLIKKSATILKRKIEITGWKVILPKVGTGKGELEWKNVKKVLEEVGLYQMNEVTIIEKG